MGKEPTYGTKLEEPGAINSMLRAVPDGSWSNFGRALQGFSLPATLLSGRFQVERRLGEGGMGIVYAGFDSERGQVVAIKTLGRIDAAGIYHLKREFRSLSHVIHPNLVRLHELFSDGDTWFFTMELVEGKSFASWLCHGLPEKRSAFTAAAWSELERRLRAALPQLVAAVDAIHRAGKLHCDLKPSNILVDHAGRAVVLDFGLVTDHRPAEIRERSDQVVGTPGYMAPEQAAGRRAGPFSDLYALGVIIFEALAGHMPFEGSAAQALASKQEREAPQISALFPEAPADLARLCERLLSRDPKKRPAVQDLIDELVAQPGMTTLRIGLVPDAPVRLVGRDGELSALRSAYARTLDGTQPVIVMLRGESGIGKSTLMSRFVTELRDEGAALVLQGRCYEQETVPFKAFDVCVDEMSQKLARMPEGTQQALAPSGANALTRLFPVLGRLSSFQHEEFEQFDRNADPHELRRRGFLAFGDLLRGLRERTPLVLHIDDLQWTDEDSITLLLHLLRQVKAPPLLFVGSHRLGDSALLRELYDTLASDIRVDFSTVELQPLSETEASQLGGGRVPDAALREAHGNPFLIRELSRFAEDNGGKDSPDLSLSAILSERCRQLDGGELRLLQTAVLSDGPLPLRIALAAAAVELGAVDGLRAHQLVRAGDRRGDLQCYHDQIRECLASSIDEGDAQALHRSLALAWASDAQQDPERVAHHFDRAGDAQRSAEYAVQAALRAEKALGFNRAARMYEWALERGRFNDEAQQQFRMAQANALANAGRSREAAKAAQLALALSDESQRAELSRLAGCFYLQGGYLEEGVPLVNRGLREFGLRIPVTEKGALATLLWERTKLKLNAYRPNRKGRNEAAIRRFDAAEQIAYALPRLDPLRFVSLATQLARTAYLTGDDVRMARGMACEAWSQTILGVPQDRVRPYVEKALELCERTADPVARFWLDLNVANAELLRDTEVSLRYFDACRDRLSAHPDPSISFLGPILEWGRQYALCLRGQYGDVAQAMPALIDEAWARDDLGVLPFLAGVPGTIARVAVEDLAGLDRDLKRAKESWSVPSFSWQAIMLAQGELILNLYQGDHEAAQDAAAEVLASAKSSLAYKAAPVRAYVHYLEAWAQLARARQLRPGAERSQLLLSARKALDFHESLDALSGTWPSPLGAAARVLQGDREGAVENLRRALGSDSSLSRLASYRACAEWGLGHLIGGDDGASLVAQARTFFEQRGVKDPNRFLSATAPGLVS